MNLYAITIEVPEGWEPKQLTPRRIEPGEFYLSVTNSCDCWPYTNASTGKYIPLQRKWIPPASCPKGVTFKLNSLGDIWYVLWGCASVRAEDFYSDFTPPPSSPYTVT